MKYYIISLLSGFIILFSSCVNYDAEPFTGYSLPRESGGFSNGITEDWIYVNLRTGKFYNSDYPNSYIKAGEEKNRLDWDIAFCGFRIRTNSGTSGIGKSGTIDLGRSNYEKWSSVRQLPSSPAWVVDNDSTVYIVISRRDWARYKLGHDIDSETPWFDPNRGPPRTLTSANPLLSQAMSFSGPPPTYTPNFHTYAIRTADGKSVYKFKLISWYNAHSPIGDQGGQLSFYFDKLRNN